MLSLILAIVACGATAQLRGHHSFAAYYFENQMISVEGELTSFEYKNPHSWVHVTATDDLGQPRTISAEWSNPNRLGRAGITQETLKRGDRLILTGSPSRKASENRMHLKGIMRPADGWGWGRR